MKTESGLCWQSDGKGYGVETNLHPQPYSNESSSGRYLRDRELRLIVGRRDRLPLVISEMCFPTSHLYGA